MQDCEAIVDSQLMQLESLIKLKKQKNPSYIKLGSTQPSAGEASASISYSLRALSKILKSSM